MNKFAQTSIRVAMYSAFWIGVALPWITGVVVIVRKFF